MRKFIFIALSVLLLLSLTALAYAEGPQITLGGNILMRGFYFNGVDFTGTYNEVYESPTYLPAKNGHNTFLGYDADFYTEAASLYTTDASITIDAKITDNLQGFMELETAQPIIGASGSYIWGTQDQKPVANLYFRQLWIKYTGSGLLGVPTGVKVGHQLLTLGEKQFLNHERFGDDAIVVFVQPTKELTIAGITAKLYEGPFSFYTPWTYYAQNTDDTDLYTILATYKLDKDNTIGINYSYISNSYLDLTFQNLGLHANGILAGALTYAAELDTQFGHVYDTEYPADHPLYGNNQLKFKGWGFMAKAGYKIDPVNLRASFAIGSGDNQDNDDKIKEFQTTMGGDDVSPLDAFVHYTQIYERTLKTAAFDQYLSGAFYRNTGIANTTYYNLGADVMATKDLSLSLDGFILRATKSWPGVSGSKSLGSELDAKGTYKITKNFNYFIEAGVFWPGNWYGDTTGIEDNNVTQVVHGINLTF